MAGAAGLDAAKIAIIALYTVRFEYTSGDTPLVDMRKCAAMRSLNFPARHRTIAVRVRRVPCSRPGKPAGCSRKYLTNMKNHMNSGAGPDRICCRREFHGIPCGTSLRRAAVLPPASLDPLPDQQAGDAD